jgi:hypothetical protein
MEKQIKQMMKQDLYTALEKLGNYSNYDTNGEHFHIVWGGGEFKVYFKNKIFSKIWVKYPNGKSGTAKNVYVAWLCMQNVFPVLKEQNLTII